MPVGDALTPEHRAPQLVQALDGAVASVQPFAEPLLAIVAVTGAAAVAAHFVIHLPAHDTCIAPETPGQLPNDAAHVATVGAIVQASRPPAPREPLLAFVVPGGHARMSREEPQRRRGRRRADDDLQPLGAEHRDGALEPVQIILPATRLQTRPGELPHAYNIHTGQPYQPGVRGPPVLRPLLRVVGYAELHPCLRTRHERFNPAALCEKPVQESIGECRF